MGGALIRQITVCPYPPPFIPSLNTRSYVCLSVQIPQYHESCSVKEWSFVMQLTQNQFLLDACEGLSTQKSDALTTLKLDRSHPSYHPYMPPVLITDTQTNTLDW